MRAASSASVPCRLIALGLLVVLGASCSSGRLSRWDEVPAVRPAEDLALLDRAREALDERDTIGAMRAYAALRERDPADVPLALALQDAEILHLERGERLEELDQWLGAHPDRAHPDVLREYWSWLLDRAEASATFVDQLLVLRVEPDRRAAGFQFDQLMEAHPDSAWAHLGAAHARLRLAEVRVARQHLDRALELDSTNVRAHRLESWVLAAEGRSELARNALDRWLDRTADDPLVTETRRDAALLESCAAHIDDQAFERASKRLDGLIGDARFDGLPVETRYRAYLLRAAALEGLELYPEALADAERAAAEFPDRLDPFIQRALLLEYRLQDPRGALDAWGRVEELASDAPAENALGAFLDAQRARVEMARITAELASAESDQGED